MKHHILLLIIAFSTIISLNARAQQGVANLGFENWSTTILGETLTGWVSLNASKETSDVFSGSAALKLETKNSIMGLQPGLATIGIMSGLTAIPGEPFSDVPGSIRGYTKFNLATGDTALFYIRLTNMGEIIASADTMFAGVQSNWTQFVLNLNWYSWGIPDSIQIGITSGGNSSLIGFNIGNTTAGSWLKADAFALGDFVSIDKMMGNTDKVQVFPNPSKGFVYIANAKNATIIIYNMLGKKVLEIRNHDAEKINLANLPAGNYIIQVNKNNVVSSHKLILTK
ncbi:MAG TPA: T9SS type A sorting domain-containing protein [Bacteroidales bacterium]|mgnify:CR=1 FL=1|nr:T9SS type A sorting domain-containing protein [Bacteroidales bacterium]